MLGTHILDKEVGKVAEDRVFIKKYKNASHSELRSRIMEIGKKGFNYSISEGRERKVIEAYLKNIVFNEPLPFKN